MARSLLPFLTLLVVGNVSCYFVRSDVSDKVNQVNTDDEFEGDVDDVYSVMGFPLLTVVDGRIGRMNGIDVPAEEYAQNRLESVDKVEVKDENQAERADDNNKKCAAVGEFCNNHSECCSRACLGYMKRCVSG